MAFQILSQLGLGRFLQSVEPLPDASGQAMQESAPKEERKTDEVAREQFLAIDTAREQEGNFVVFPPEVKVLILQAASFDHWYDRDLQRMLLVNKRWHSLIHSALLEDGDTKGLFVSQILAKAGFDLEKIDPSVKGIVLGDTCREKLQRLELKGFRLTDEKLIAICAHFHNLKILKLDFSYLKDAGIQNTGLRYPNLIELKVANDALTDTSLQAIAAICTKLQRINFRYSWQCTALGVLALVQQNPGLSHLSFRNLEGAGQLLELLPQMCPKLTHLEVRGYPSITASQFIAYFKSRPNLFHLDISFNKESVTDEVLFSIGQNCPNLTSLDVSSNEVFTEYGIKEFLESYPPESCPLECLDLSFTKCSDEMLQTVGALARHLKVIRLIGTEGITDAGVCHVIEHCRLRVLNLWGGAITDRTLEAIGRYQSDLEELDITSCSLLSQEGFEAAILQCPNLVHLELLDTQITITASLAEVIAKKLLHLRELSIGQPISGQAVAHLVHPATQLTHLDICGPKITDNELKLIAERCRKLRDLAITGGSVTSKGLRHLLQRCWVLERMSCIRSTVTITIEEKAALYRDYWFKCTFMW